MFNEYFDKKTSLNFDTKIDKEHIIKLISEYIRVYSSEDTKQEWFDRLKTCAEYCGFAGMKEYKANPEAFIGNIADASNIIRIAITGRSNTPDLYELLQILGSYEVHQRLEYVLNNLK